MNTNFKDNIITTIILLLASTIIFLIVYFTSSSPVLYITLSNSFLVCGAITLSMFVLSLITRTGIFDVVGYSANTFIASFRKEEEKKFQDAYHYKEYKRKRRLSAKKVVLPYVIIGGIELIIATVFTLLH